jgi:hypothetical protein
LKTKHDWNENDRLTFDIHEKVCWKDGQWWVSEIGEAREDTPLYDCTLDKSKIIGNIFDNSKLLNEND